MKRLLTLCLIGTVLLVTTHRSPAPVTEIAETPSATPAPKPSPTEAVEEKTRAKKPKTKSAENETPAKHAGSEPSRASVSGTWHGHWDNNRGDQGMATMTFNEGPNGTITGFADTIPFSPKPPIENGHRSGNVMTFTFHRMSRDYQVTMTLSSDGSTLNGQYKVTQNQKLIYSGTYTDFKRR
jgi:hypothetical protein